MADINSSDQELNELKIKTDSLPNNWLVTLVNPATGAVAENMTIARFIELLPFISDQKNLLNTNLIIRGSASGKAMLSDENGYAIFGNQYSSGFPYISYGMKYREKTDILVSTSDVYLNRFIFYFSDSGIFFGNAPRQTTPIGEEIVGFSGFKRYGSIASASYANDLTDTILEEVFTSDNTPMTLQEDGQPALVTQIVERHEYSIPKMAETILSLRKEIDELKGGSPGE